MRITQSRSFESKVKRFSKPEKDILDSQVRKIAADTTIGEEKRGDLRGVRVYKFKINATQYLLAYRFINDELQLIMIGPHENYYRDLRTYLK